MLIPNLRLTFTALPPPIFELPSHILDIQLPEYPSNMPGGGSSGGGGGIPSQPVKNITKYLDVSKSINYIINPPVIFQDINSIQIQLSKYIDSNIGIIEVITKDINIVKNILCEVI